MKSKGGDKEIQCSSSNSSIRSTLKLEGNVISEESVEKLGQWEQIRGHIPSDG